MGWDSSRLIAPSSAAAARWPLSIPHRRFPRTTIPCCKSEPSGYDDRYRWIRPGWVNERRRWVRQPEPVRRWVEAENALYLSDSGGGGFLVLYYNILGDDNASKHRDLYSSIPFGIMNWEFRRWLILQEIIRSTTDILRLQEVVQWHLLQYEEGRISGFHLLEEDSIEFKNFDIRDNVAQLCVFEIRVLLRKASQLSKKWGDIPIVLVGDFNSTPQLNLTMHDRRHLSGQRCQAMQFDLSSFLEVGWSTEELKIATGKWGCTQLEHSLKLQSSYASVKGSSRTTGFNNEPLATTYHSKFIGTVDYIWYSTGLAPLKVLDTLPIDALQRIGGIPSKVIGRDHLALASEIVFMERHNSNSFKPELQHEKNDCCS